MPIIYSHAMSQSLPTENFKFLSQKEIEKFDMSKTAATDDVGFNLEVDLKYPVHLHELHNDYPLAAEKIKITHDVLSPYSQSLIIKIQFDRKTCTKSKRQDKVCSAL